MGILYCIIDILVVIVRIVIVIIIITVIVVTLCPVRSEDTFRIVTRAEPMLVTTVIRTCLDEAVLILCHELYTFFPLFPNLQDFFQYTITNSKKVVYHGLWAGVFPIFPLNLSIECHEEELGSSTLAQNFLFPHMIYMKQICMLKNTNENQLGLQPLLLTSPQLPIRQESGMTGRKLVKRIVSSECIILKIIQQLWGKTWEKVSENRQIKEQVVKNVEVSIDQAFLMIMGPCP